MTTNEAITLLRDRVKQYDAASRDGKGGKARAARELGYSAPVITQLLKEPPEYSGSMENVTRKIIETYGGRTVSCPILGDIPLAQCREEQKKPFRGTNEQAVQLYRACRSCERGSK
jgi:hypothetical protein